MCATVNEPLCTSWNHSLGKFPEAKLLDQRVWMLLRLLINIENLLGKLCHFILHLLRRHWLGERWQGPEPGWCGRDKDSAERGIQDTFLTAHLQALATNGLWQAVCLRVYVCVGGPGWGRISTPSSR